MNLHGQRAVKRESRKRRAVFFDQPLYDWCCEQARRRGESFSFFMEKLAGEARKRLNEALPALSA